jgi:hypothetical protein
MKLNLVFSLILAGAGLLAAQPPQVTRKNLHQPQTIQGYPCARGIAWFFTDGKLQRCTVDRETAFGEEQIPADTYIALNPDGTPRFIQMSHDAPIMGLNCLGGSWLGSGEGAVVDFYPSGKLELCYLAHAQLVQGVPCARGGFWESFSHVDPGVSFYESGKLKACKLAKDFGGEKAGTRFSQSR